MTNAFVRTTSLDRVLAGRGGGSTVLCPDRSAVGDDELVEKASTGDEKSRLHPVARGGH